MQLLPGVTLRQASEEGNESMLVEYAYQSETNRECRQREIAPRLEHSK